jgi:hypothetical protein
VLGTNYSRVTGLNVGRACLVRSRLDDQVGEQLGRLALFEHARLARSLVLLGKPTRRAKAGRTGGKEEKKGVGREGKKGMAGTCRRKDKQGGMKRGVGQVRRFGLRIFSIFKKGFSFFPRII